MSQALRRVPSGPVLVDRSSERRVSVGLGRRAAAAAALLGESGRGLDLSTTDASDEAGAPAAARRSPLARGKLARSLSPRPIVTAPSRAENETPELDAFEGDFAPVPAALRRGRGATGRPDPRFDRVQRREVDDGWESLRDEPSVKTEVTIEKARTIISRNESPDLSFDRSVNPYRGCEHGCSYCYARPSHATLGLSPGLDFETKLVAKTNAAELLARELSAETYQARTICLGANTDPYQPIEKEFRLTRGVLEVLARFNHPVGIVTKSASVTRDLDILAPMAAKGLAKVAISLTTLDPALARKMEPRASSPQKRLAAIRELSEAGVPVTVLVAPVIPGVNDAEVESILSAAREAGAREAGYVLLRLPLEVRDVFRNWLLEHFPAKAKHVLSLMRSTHGGKEYDATFGVRHTGGGPYAWLLGRRFELACERLGFPKTRAKLRADLFSPPAPKAAQLALF